MLVSASRRPYPSLKSLLGFLIGLSALAALLFYIAIPYYLQVQSYNADGWIYCDAEQIWQGQYISDGHWFDNGRSQSVGKAFRGKAACYLPKAEGLQFGFGIRLRKEIQPGQICRANVWVYSKSATAGHLVIAGAENPDFYFSTNSPTKKQRGWKLLELEVPIPSNFPYEYLHVYVYSDGNEDVYFDDLGMQFIERDTIQRPLFVPQRLALTIKDKAFRQLKQKRSEAFKLGILRTDEDSWVKATLSDEGSTMPIKLRLKGDWLDHLQGDKWSFRIKVKDPHAWNRMKTFSVQSPAARYFALEWLLHHFWQEQDVLTTRYDFVRLEVNGDAKGAYAWEEHFDKQLLEYNARREGPILRYSEEALWDVRVRQNNTTGIDNYHRPAIAEMHQASVKAFKESRTLTDPVLVAHYQTARQLLQAWQRGEQVAEQVFDLDRMGRYFAIADILGAAHTYIWHNQRFYFNPITQLLEPIGYDGFSGRPRKDPLPLAKALIENGTEKDAAPLLQLFENEIFIEWYMHYLFTYSNADFLENYLERIWPEMQARIAFLKAEFPAIKISQARILERAKQLRSKFLPYDKHSVQASWALSNDQTARLQLSNVHELPLQVIGVGTSARRIRDSLRKAVHLPAFRMGYPRVYRSIEAPIEARYVFYKAYGLDSVFNTAILPYTPSSQSPSPRQEIFKNRQIQSNSYYAVQGQQIRFHPKRHTIAQPIVIPANYEVVLERGTELDFVEGAYFISKSPLQILGNSEYPVLITSSDQSGRGITILQAPAKSNIHYAVIDGLTNFQHKGWQLTGAMTFYESDVNISHSIIRNNHCEDALNIIRASFELDGVEIYNTYSDAFDADFCSGNIRNAYFHNTGNDAIDVSGSQITIENCIIEHSGDKGVSVGEESKAELHSLRIQAAQIGIASKDLSYVRVDEVELVNCRQGFAAYQKKPEYGQSTIFVKDYVAEEVAHLYTIAARCTLEINGRMIVGD